MKKVFLSMYLRKNLGDDLFLKIICDRYEDVKFYASAKKASIAPLGIKNICGAGSFDRIIRRLLGGKYCRINAKIRNYCAMVILGGSMFIEKRLSEEELSNAIDNTIIPAPLFVIGANFGPYNNDYYYSKYKTVFSRAEDVCFRDSYSVELFNGLEVVRKAPDIIFSLDTRDYSVKKEKKIVISAIDLSNRADLSQYRNEYEEKMAEMAQRYTNDGYRVVLMSFCEYQKDDAAIRRIYDMVVNKEMISMHFYNGDIKKALDEIASCEAIIGTRFHSIVLGLVFNKKVLPIIYSNKTKNMLNDIKYKGCTIDISQISALDVNVLDEYVHEYGDTSLISKEAEKHFEKLDKFLGKQ